MRFKKIIGTVLVFLLPSLVFATVGATWQSLSPTNGTISPSLINGTQQSVSAKNFTATSNATTTIPNLNNIFTVPADFSTNGCAGSGANTTFQSCVHALYALASTNGLTGVKIIIANNVPQSAWTGTLNFDINNVVPSLVCLPGVTLKYGGTGTAINWNFGNPIGHLVSDDSGCTYMGQNTLIAAGQTNSATTVGMLFGGTNGAVAMNIHDNSFNGFGRNWEIGQNAYMLSFNYNSNSGGNCGLTAMLGCLVYINPANNSGERNVFNGNNFTDPGNSTTTNAIYIANGATASNFFTNSSMDDVQVRIGASNGLTSFDGIHVENAAYGTYGSYIPFLGTSAQSTQISMNNIEIANDGNNSTNGFKTIILHGNNLYASGIHIDNYGGQTIDIFSDHSLNNGSESEVVCQTQVQGGALTEIVHLQAYSQQAGATCIHDVSNSYPVSIIQNSNNVANIRNGNQNVATFDNNGNWTFAGNVGVSSTTPGSILSVGTANGINFTTATSTFNSTGGINLSAGCYAINSTCLSTGGGGSGIVGSGTTGQFPFYGASGTTLTATSSIFVGTNSFVGIGSTSPYQMLSVGGNMEAKNVIAKGANATFELYNTNDSQTKRSFFQTTYDSLQFGYGTDDNDQMRLYIGKLFLGGNSVISTTHTQGVLGLSDLANVLDDGSGNASFTGKVGIGTSTPLGKFQVSNGVSATTTSTFGEIGQTSSKACFNTKNTAGAGISFYFVGTSMVVENNLCR